MKKYVESREEKRKEEWKGREVEERGDEGEGR